MTSWWFWGTAKSLRWGGLQRWKRIPDPTSPACWLRSGEENISEKSAESWEKAGSGGKSWRLLDRMMKDSGYTIFRAGDDVSCVWSNDSLIFDGMRCYSMG